MQDRADRPARRQGARTSHYAGGVKGFVEYMNRSQDRAAPERSSTAVGEKDGITRRGGDAVERLLRRERCCASPTTSRSATAAPTSPACARR
ncbi:MAG: hypothetical protein MZW92_76585 [Comamonadaceae bacterium]|nr:hypothetical protein [Comamonadaceae bacterium]